MNRTVSSAFEKTWCKEKRREDGKQERGRGERKGDSFKSGNTDLDEELTERNGGDGQAD